MIETKVVWFKDFTRWDVDFFIGTQNILTNFKLEFLGNMLKPRKEKIRANNYDGITPIVSKIPFSTEHIEIRKDLTTKMDMYAVYKDDLLVSNINFHQGALAICKDDKLFASTHYQPYIIDNKLINSKFLIFILKSKAFQDYVKTKKTKGIKTESNFNFIKNLQIPLPPMEIQNKIVADIEEIQNKIKALQKQEKELKDEIERYIYIALGLEKEQKVEQKKAFVVEFKDLNRWDVAYNQNTKINNTTYKYDIEELNNICYMNPKINLKNLIKEDKSVSFLSMDSVENDGKTFYPKLKKANENKGFMKFQNNDLLWAKITPCMQNKKSLIVNNLENGYGFGSTEFFVLRPKDLSEVDMKFILEFLRTDYVIEKAKETFKGSAGQQRVPKEFLEDLQIPLPPLNIQKEIVNFVENKKRAIKENQIKIIDLTKEINNTIDKIFIS